MRIEKLVKKSNQNARDKGFWDMELRVLRKMKTMGFDEEEINAVKMAFMSQKLMLIVSELGEAVEALRKNDNANFNEELADVLIRLGDFACGYGIDLEFNTRLKMEKNKEIDCMESCFRRSKYGWICEKNKKR